MPAIITRGAITAKGFGFGAAGVADGTYGVFALGNNNSTTQKYTFASKTVAGYSSLGSAYWSGAAGNSTKGVYWAGGGSVAGCTNSGATQKVIWATTTISSGTTLAGIAGNYGGMTGNATQAIAIRGGYGSTYTYSNDTTAAVGTRSNITGVYNDMASNATNAVVTSQGGTATDLYTYSSTTFASSTSFTSPYTPAGYLNTVYNSSYAAFWTYRSICCVSYIAYNKWNWSNNSINSNQQSTSQNTSSLLAGVSNNTYGYAAINPPSTLLLTFSAGTFASGTSIGTPMGYAAATSNGNAGVTM